MGSRGKKAALRAKLGRRREGEAVDFALFLGARGYAKCSFSKEAADFFQRGESGC